MRRLTVTVGILVLFSLALAAPARAQGYFAPFVGFDFGGDAGKCPGSTIPNPLSCSTNRTVYGFGAGYLSHGTLGAEVDFGYAPHFFGNGATISGNNVLTFMGNIVVGIPAGPVHPYVAGGIGLIRTSVDQFSDLTNFSDSSFSYNLGGGLLVFLPAHVGFRIDYRYMNTFSDITAVGLPLLTTGTKLNFHRLVFAFVLH